MTENHASTPVTCDVCQLPMEGATWQQRRHKGECHREHERRRRRAGYHSGRHASTTRKTPTEPKD